MKSFPFDSVVNYNSDGIPEYDRPYDADALRTAFMVFFSNGVFYSDSSSLKVAAAENNTMTVNINPGQIHINGVVGNEQTMRSVELEAAHTTYPRIDRIVCRLNDNQAVRALDIYVIKGTAATIPIAPAPVRTGNIYDMVLADIYVVPNATRIGADRITDKRLDDTVCGIVTANPQHVDTTALYNQFQTALDEYLQLVDDAVDGTLAVSLQNRLDALEVSLDEIVSAETVSMFADEGLPII